MTQTVLTRFQRFLPTFLVLIGSLCLAAMARADARSVLPPASAVKGWKMIGAQRTYNASNLYDLIDGEAQAVLNYSFVSAAHAEYAPAGASKPALTIDVYDMKDPIDAFGLFGSDRLGGTPVAVGTEGVQMSGGLDFWKGQYVVRTALVQSSLADRAAQLAFARAAAARIHGPGGRPVMVAMLPPGYTARTETYERVNVAGQSYIQNAVSARYPSAGPQAELSIAAFGSPAAARQAYTRYQSYITSSSNMALGAHPVALRGVGDSAVAVKSRISGQIVAALKGRYLIVVRRARDPAAAQNLVRAALNRAH
ncbi:MAG TPA: DUF6599 family protein [Chthonomonadaceae bacterium]|nr:DUF6599 family protein [Chthonomonadaceae bacterium]